MKITSTFLSKSLFVVIITVFSGQLFAAGAYSSGGRGGNAWQYENVSDDAYSSYSKGKKNLRKKRYEKALGYLRKAERIDGESADIQNLLGYTYRHLNEFDLSFKHYKKALTIDPEHVGATEYLGQLYVTMGKIDMANKQLAQLKTFCGVRCDEYQSLSKAIAENQSEAHAALIQK